MHPPIPSDSSHNAFKMHAWMQHWVSGAQYCRPKLPGVFEMQLAEGARTGWFVGILWILQSESFLEVAMILQILPILLVPLQIIFNNVLEEVLSWVYGTRFLCLTAVFPTVGLFTRTNCTRMPTYVSFKLCVV